MADWTITEIKNITECEAQKMALETLHIKDHTIYLVDFGGYFGYSRLVFAEGHHIHYANDYELHHKHYIKDREELRRRLIDGANRKLYTEAELVGPVKDYDDYLLKVDYLRNYYAMRRDYISIFFVGTDEERAARREQAKNMIFDPVGFCYIDDAEFVKHHVALFKALEEQKDKMADDFEYYKAAFLREMYNHEYAINWQADYDVISEFANVNGVADYEDLAELFNAAHFNETQKSAYLAARGQYGKEQREAC